MKLIAILTILLLTSCNDEVPKPTPRKEKKYTSTANITKDYIISVKSGSHPKLTITNLSSLTGIKIISYVTIKKRTTFIIQSLLTTKKRYSTLADYDKNTNIDSPLISYKISPKTKHTSKLIIFWNNPPGRIYTQDEVKILSSGNASIQLHNIFADEQ